MKKEVMKIIESWSKETGLKVEITDKGLKVIYTPKLERKGAYVMELDDLNYDLPIVNKAIVDYLMSGIYPEETINNCNVLKDFQKIIKISSNYKLGWHNGNYLNDKTFRVFASKNKSDSYIGKCRDVGETIEKFANTPEHCFIYNDNVNGLKVDESLDKRWYINLAEKRLNDFGIDLNEDSLF